MKLKDDYVTLSHGAGGKASAALVEQVFVSGYGNKVLEELTDAGVLPLAELLGADSEGEALSRISPAANWQCPPIPM